MVAPRVVCAVAIALAGLPAAAAEVVDGLYRGEAIVTGQDNPEERDRGVREALTEVLVKVSGDARVAADPRLPPILERAASAVSSLAYQDRLARKTLMDEQGTRERSFHLRIDFAPPAVDAALADLGARPWGTVRPKVLVLLAVRDLAGSYILMGDGERGYGQRESLRAVARWTADGTRDTVWRLNGAEEESWRVNGVSFDRALAAGLDRTVRLLAALP
jgi:hypothetical protein